MKANALINYVNDTSKSLGLSELAYPFFLAHEITRDKPQREAILFARHKSEQVAWFYAMANIKPSECRKLGFSNKDELYLQAMDSMAQLAKTNGWHAWKCTSRLGIYKRIKPFKGCLKSEENTARALRSLLSGHIGVANRLKLGPEQQVVLICIYGDGTTKPGWKRTHKIYTDRADKMIEFGQWKAQDSYLSLSSMKVFLSKPEVRKLWFQARQGSVPMKRIY